MNLPKGWRREEVARRHGLSAGKVDVYYYSPDGQRYRNKAQLARALGESVDLTAFDFRTGKINPAVARKAKQAASLKKGISYEYLRGLKCEASLVPPIRQTASIFKQPVTVIYHMTNTSTKHELKHGPQEKPKQLFWERRLQGLAACDKDCNTLQSFELPRNIKGISSDLSQDTLLRSIATALHMTSSAIVGQVGANAAQDKHPAVYMNPDQPLVQALVVTEDDIRKQEEQVVRARKQLEGAYNELRMVMEQ